MLDLKWQNHLKVGTVKPKLKVKMQSVSDDDVRKRLLEKPRFELVANGVLRLGKCYILLSCSYILHCSTIVHFWTSWSMETEDWPAQTIPA